MIAFTKLIKSKINEPGCTWLTYNNNYAILSREIGKNLPLYDAALTRFISQEYWFNHYIELFV